MATLQELYDDLLLAREKQKAADRRLKDATQSYSDAHQRLVSALLRPDGSSMAVLCHCGHNNDELKHPVAVTAIRGDIQEVDLLKADKTQVAPLTVCGSCGESHPSECICPPHEVRSTGCLPRRPA